VTAGDWKCVFDQGWWSRLNFYGSGSCSGAGHFSFMAPTPVPFVLNFAGSELKFAISH